MKVMNADTRRERARRTDGRFGTQQRSDPEVALRSTPAMRVVNSFVPHTRRGVPRGLFRRRADVTEYVEVTSLIRVSPPDVAIPGARGERIYQGQAYLPITADRGVRVHASPGALTDLMHAFAATADTSERSRKDAEAQLREHMGKRAARVLVINEQIWVRASDAPALSNRREHHEDE